ncbi:MAG: hypothetical protein ACK4F9_06970 [Brevinematia bacterium]
MFPDKIEGKNSKNHRKLSHWFVLYLIPLLFLLFAFKANSLLFVSSKYFLDHMITMPFPFFAYFSAFWFLLGCILHIIEDALTGRVPLLSPNKKNFSLKITSTGSLFEYALSFLLLAIVLFTLVFSSRTFS